MRHFFLTGTSGIGKSTLLMEVLQEAEFSISGFFAQRQLLPAGTTGGFRLLPWSSKHPLTATYQAEASDLFIKKSDTGWQKDLHVCQTTYPVFLLKDSFFPMVLPEAFVSSLGAANILLLPHIRQKHPICS